MLLSHGAKEYFEVIGGFVTHVLVGADANPTKLEESREIHDIPNIVGFHWVVNCIKARTLLPVYPDIFSELVVSCSGIGMNDIKTVWAAMSLHGGILKPRLDLQRCNLLICGQPSGVINFYIYCLIFIFLAESPVTL